MLNNKKIVCANSAMEAMERFNANDIKTVKQFNENNMESNTTWLITFYNDDENIEI